MGAATPTLETVVTAIKTQIDAISPSVGTVLTGFHGYEDEVEYILRNSYIASGAMNLWFVDVADVDEVEGPATQENYEQYNIKITYWSSRKNDVDWSKKARQNAEAVRDKLSLNSAIFAIGGQRQVRTPETVQIESHGPFDIDGTDGAQRIYRTVVALAVEGRRFA